MKTEASLEAFFADPDRRARLLAASESALMEKLTTELKWGLPDTLSKICAEFIENEIAPIVREHLASQKGAIIEAAMNAADEVGQKVAEAMVSKATKALTGYNGDKLLRDLFS